MKKKRIGTLRWNIKRGIDETDEVEGEDLVSDTEL
jgi:hypothetical protein